MGETNTPIFNDFWILEPIGTLIYGFECANVRQRIWENVGALFEQTLYIDLKVMEIKKWECGTGRGNEMIFWMRQQQLVLTIVLNTTENNMVESYNILKILTILRILRPQ